MIKSKKSALKRFKKNSSGNFKHKQSHLKHILTKKSSKRKRQLGKLKIVSHSDKRAIKKMLPNF